MFISFKCRVARNPRQMRDSDRQDRVDSLLLERGKAACQPHGEEGGIRDRQPSSRNQNNTQNIIPIVVMSALEIIDQVPEFARLVALELRRFEAPHKDAITTNNAYKIYGRGWIEKHTERGHLHPVYHGNRKFYSKAEIERVIVKENVVARVL